jgi:hypothetical protein
MDALVDEILQRIIHKAMGVPRGFAPANKGDAIRTRKWVPKPVPLAPCMAGVLPAFVNHFKLDGLQDFLQPLCHL